MAPQTLPTNADIADRFELFADLLEIEGGHSRHRVVAYRRGAARARTERQSLAQLALDGRAVDLADIGGTLQDKIVELATTGTIASLDTLSERVPPGLAQLARLRGIGPRRALAIWTSLGVTTLDELAAAIGDRRLATVPGIGARTVNDVSAQLDALRSGTAADDRVPRVMALPLARDLVADLASAPGVVRAEIAGGLRRGAETVHDIDLVCAIEPHVDIAAVIEESDLIRAIDSHGEAGLSATTHAGIRVDIRTCSPEAFGNLLQHLTGSRAHNVRLRERAVAQGKSVSEHGVTDEAGTVHLHATEDGVYAELGLMPIPPELREDDGEIALAAENALPALVTAADVRGELHMHTTWSDGRDSLAAMVDAARSRGMEYIAISDHSQSLAFAGGLTPESVRAQWTEIDDLAAETSGIAILKSCEVDILTDGSVDFDDDLLAQFDWVTASLHSGFRQSERQLTERILAAIDHPFVNCIGHPTGRKFGQREAYPIDLEAVVTRAAQTGTALEINAQPRRMDLNAQMARVALAHGVRLTIGTDAHSVHELGILEYGLVTARRAGATAERIVNCWPVDEIQEFRARKRARLA